MKSIKREYQPVGSISVIVFELRKQFMKRYKLMTKNDKLGAIDFLKNCELDLKRLMKEIKSSIATRQAVDEWRGVPENKFPELNPDMCTDHDSDKYAAI